jgi:hypothetical protein
MAEYVKNKTVGDSCPPSHKDSPPIEDSRFVAEAIIFIQFIALSFVATFYQGSTQEQNKHRFN